MSGRVLGDVPDKTWRAGHSAPKIQQFSIQLNIISAGSLAASYVARNTPGGGMKRLAACKCARTLGRQLCMERKGA